MPPCSPMNMPKSVIDLMRPSMRWPRAQVGRELVPRVRAALLDTQRDAAALLVDVEHHDLHLVAYRDDLGRVDVLVGPVHFGDVHQTFDALLDFGEAAVIGEVRHRGGDPGALRIASREIHPGIVAELLHAERHAVLLAVELEDLDLYLVADRHHFARVANAAPGHVRDVEQAVHAAEVHEGTVVG